MGMYCGDEEVIGFPKYQKPQQPQQQIIVEEQQLPLRTSATPVCDTSDTTMQKQEASDEKNDFGMSPEDDSSDSTSPMSEQFFSVDSCDLSPERDSWPDSDHPTSNNSDYNNTHEMFNQCRISQDLQTINDSDHASKGDAWSESFQCPVCKEISINRDSFSEHLISHYGNRSECLDIRKNETDSPVPGPSGVNKRRSSRNRSEQSENNETEEAGLRVPRVNSQGRVKTFRCKQCSFVSVTKLQFWIHNRLHIRADKLLICPNCPFVTEYKHHLEYHLRNHYGSKPFKCDKCSYTCVNKSMLNSHLKSHSNIYQYRCADCIYATKYCHSLKLHLRKYGHYPAMVLNADGSPNPLPIIDIYGTRRGPKNKTKAQRVHAKITRANRARSENAKRSSPQELKPTTKTSTITSFETSMNLTGARPFTINMVSDEDARTNSVVNDANTESRSSLIAHNPVSNDISVPNQNPVEETQERLIPLDLSIREQPNCNENINEIDQTKTKLISSINARSSSRRKGKAYKLDRRQVFSENESDEYITAKSSQVIEFATIEQMHMSNIENDIKKHHSEDPLKNHQSEDSSENHTILRLGNHQLENPTKNHEKAGSSNNYQAKICRRNHSKNHKSVGNEAGYWKRLSLYENPNPPYIHFS